MVNVGLNPASLLGIAIAVAGAALYFLRSMRPELARDHDIFFAAVGLLCGGILFFQGWRLDPILLFGQLLLTGATVFFAFESIRLRSVATEQARRSTPIFDEDRPVSRQYTAELEELEPYEDDEPPVRRIRSARDGSNDRSRSNNYSNYIDELEEESRSTRRANARRPGSNRPSSDRPVNDRSVSNRGGDRPMNDRSASDRPGKRRPARPDNTYADASYGDSNDFVDDAPPERSPERRSRSGPPRSASKPERNIDPDTKAKRPRPRPNSNSNSSADSDYVDYQPLDYKGRANRESDNSSNFDDDLA
jgi:hypothetical protein